MSRSIRTIFIIGVVVFVLFILLSQSLIPLLRSGAHWLIRPLYSARLMILEYSKIVATLKDVVSENHLLSQENKNLRSQINTLKEVEHENSVFKKQLGLNSPPEIKLIAASVVGFDPDSFFQSVVLDKGISDGIKKGAAVVSEGFLVGIIENLDQHSSKVQLISSHRTRLAVKLQDSRSLGLLRGGLTGIIIEDIPIDVLVKPGETIVTAGQSPIFRAGIPIGSVDQALSSKSDIFQTFSVKSPISFRSLDIVFIES